MASPYFGDWQKQWQNSLASNPAFSTPPAAAPGTGTSNMGTRIGEYYTSAMAKDPRMPVINRNMAGTIAPDVKRQIAQAAAERGISIGSYGGGNDETALLRALGLTSMDLSNKGVEQYGQVYGQVPQYSPASILGNLSAQSQIEQRRISEGQQISAQNAARGNAAMAANSAAWNNAKPTSPMIVGGFGGGGSRSMPQASASDGNAKADAILNGILSRYGSGSEDQPGSSVSPTPWGGFGNQPPLTSGDVPQQSFDYNPWIDDYVDPYAGQVSNQLDDLFGVPLYG